ncbi:MAG: PfkB domain protein [Mycetocola sp.]|nr:PfkB domain protein [Mycetocola sp.]
MCVGETMAMVAPTSLIPLAEGDLFTITAGGAESNVASHLAAMGFESIWLSRLGDDALGDRISAILADRGVDISWVARDTTARTGVYFKNPVPGRHKPVSYYRANSAASRMSAEDLRDWPLRDATWVHTSGITAALSEQCSSLVERIIDDAAELGYGVSFDVNYRPALWETRAAAAQRCLGLGRKCQILLVGLDEAQELWGISTAEDVADLFESVPSVVVKDGSIEAVEIVQHPGSAREIHRVPAMKVDVVEAVGAGDAFAAAYLRGYFLAHTPETRLAAGHHLAAWTLGSLEDHRPMSTHELGEKP